MEGLIPDILKQYAGEVGFISLIIGVLSVLTTESIKILYNTLARRSDGSGKSFSRIGWWINIIIVLMITSIVILSMYHRGVFKNWIEIYSIGIVVALAGWILSTLFYRKILKSVFLKIETVLLKIKIEYLEEKMKEADYSIYLQKKRRILINSLKIEKLEGTFRDIYQEGRDHEEN